MSFLDFGSDPEPRPKKKKEEHHQIRGTRADFISIDEGPIVLDRITYAAPQTNSESQEAQAADRSLDHLKFVYRSIMLKTSHCSKEQMLREIKAKLEEFE
jgi:hypothetical protein